MTAPVKHPVIAGAGGLFGGGKGGGGGSGASSGTEAPNSLRSKQVARVVDLISEGPILQIVGGMKGVWFDGVRVQNDDNTYNFQNASIATVLGYPDQPPFAGMSTQEAEVAVNIQVKTTTPTTRTIINPDVDRARLTVSVPALSYSNKNTGDVSGTSVQFDILLQSNGGGFLNLGRQTIQGKTNSRYQRDYAVPLVGSPPWDIRLVRVTADSTVLELQNDLYWDSFTQIIDAKVNYTLSACIGYVIDGEQFQAIPKRVALVDGLLVQIPNNYNPFQRTYAGVWNGGFVLNWSNNPAWVLYDLITNHRYGIGDFISPAQVDKWSFYKIAQWCDGLVQDGRGGWEPRFLCNSVISSQQEAFDLLNSFASIFRGFTFWTGGLLVAVADMPADPVGQYSQANVIEGQFTYTGGDIRARHNQALVTWNDPANLGEPRIAIVEDHEGVARLGIQKTDLVAIGCRSESQAVRAGRWLLYTEQYEAEVVAFKAGLDSAWARPGDIIRIADATVGGERRGGRVVWADINGVVLDSDVLISAVASSYLSCVVGEGLIETRIVHFTTGAPTRNLLLGSPFSSAPLPDSIWVLASADLEPTLWRVTGVKESENATVEITALRHRPDKWNHIEWNLPLSEPDISNIGIPAIRNLSAIDYLVAISAISVGVQMLISWESDAPSFEVLWRPQNGNWSTLRTDQHALDVPVVEGLYEIMVTPLNVLGQRGPTAMLNHTVVGRYAPPSDPQNFRVQSVQGVALFQWAPIKDLDVIIGGAFELRYSPQTSGATWASANTIVTSIPGTATTVEVPYRPGTYFLRTYDVVGVPSVNAAVVITTGPDTAYSRFTRICEQPTFTGSKINTEIRHPQEWLVIGATGGLWDDQLTNIDTWPTVDVLPIGASGAAPGDGRYYFANRIDMGGVFSTRLTVDMLAFPLIESSATYVDTRPGTVDTWADWDNAAGDGSGMVTILVRQTNDAPGAGARWTDWKQFISGEYTGRAFEFQAWLAAPPGENVAIEQLCIIADISNKVDQQADVPWVQPKMHFAYKVKFYSIPALAIAIQQGVQGDTFRITNKTREGFDLELLTTGGAVITGARTVDWQASGY